MATSQTLRRLTLFGLTAALLLVGPLPLIAPAHAHGVNRDLLAVLLQNGAITQDQHTTLIAKLEQEQHGHEDVAATAIASAPASSPATSPVTAQPSVETLDTPIITEALLEETIAQQVAIQVDQVSPIKASYTDKGFRFESRDGNWQTNLQWRAQMRYTNPFGGDPRQLSNFDAPDQATFENRRLRAKIGGHGYRPWLKYYFEVDLQPTRDTDDSAASASARVIDWRIDIAKWDWGGVRLGQWKVDYNRERVDSSGRQQFVERSIVNRVFTVDRQVGVQLRGHAFKNTRSDLRWYLGAFTGEGRGVRNTDDNLLYVGRLQWNFLGRDLALRQTDVEFTELPTASLAFGASTTIGSCTRWSSSGCGNLDGFTSPADAAPDQFKVQQAVQEFAYKWRGLSIQQELHHKEIEDRVAGTKSRLTGGYLQAGYFFHHLFPTIPEQLEVAARYAYIEEPNSDDLTFDNERQEFTLGANWFFAGHNNKITFDVSRLSLDDDFVGRNESENRVRLQWDVSF